MCVVFVDLDYEVVFVCYDVVCMCCECVCVYVWYVVCVEDCIDWKVFEQFVCYYCFCVVVVFFCWLEDEVYCVVEIFVFGQQLCGVEYY